MILVYIFGIQSMSTSGPSNCLKTCCLTELCERDQPSRTEWAAVIRTVTSPVAENSVFLPIHATDCSCTIKMCWLDKLFFFFLIPKRTQLKQWHFRWTRNKYICAQRKMYMLMYCLCISKRLETLLFFKNITNLPKQVTIHAHCDRHFLGLLQIPWRLPPPEVIEKD